MNIGVFDSGLGGLYIAKSLMQALPEYDYVYLGDTKRVPYGNRSREAVTEFTQEAVSYLIEQQNCELVVLACNTASAEALRTIQQGYIAQKYPDKRVLGVLIPTAETVMANQLGSVGVLATQSTVTSGSYSEEIHKLNPDITVHQQAAPLLVPMIEHGGMQWIEPILRTYIDLLLEKNVEGIVLGCTHYVAIKELARSMAGTIPIISQDELLPELLKDYLVRHPDFEAKLSKNGSRCYYVTDGIENAGFQDLLTQEERLKVEVISLT